MSRGGWIAKGFLDDRGGILKLARMKNLKMLAALVLLCGTAVSCGVPMATLRSVKNAGATAVNAMNTVTGAP